MVFGSAFLLPSYLGKGRIELTLSKPISRWQLLTMKFISVYVIHMVILLLTVFLIWLTISLAIGALTRSGALAIMGYFAVRFAANLLESREIAYQFLGETVWTSILDWMYYLFPKYGEVGDNFLSLMRGDGFVNFFSVYTTFIFSAVLYGLTLYIISRRDY